ncbi:MAG: hypothetical protein O3A18_12205, partial [Planctomycetota bacterium]|nr:hypothetical protein [Planctomycetota bacterium]
PAVALVAALSVPTTAEAVSPRNPYRSFNLSGVNYGSMRWEQAQRQGRRVWPYYNTPSRSSSRSSNVVVGGATGSGGAVMMQPRSTSSRRGLFRRR